MTRILIETDQEIESLTISFKGGKMTASTRPEDAITKSQLAPSGVDTSKHSDENWEEPLEFSTPSSFQDRELSPDRASDSVGESLDGAPGFGVEKSAAPATLPNIEMPDISTREQLSDTDEGMSMEEL